MRGWRITAVLAVAMAIGSSGSAWAIPFDFATRNDHELGVCSEGGSCSTGGDDVNEISHLTDSEGIRLTLPTGFDPTTKDLLKDLWFASGSTDCNRSGPICNIIDRIIERRDHSPVPEPATLALVGTGLVGLMVIAWRRTRRA